jgi:hypothetical protein
MMSTTDVIFATKIRPGEQFAGWIVVATFFILLALI